MELFLEKTRLDRRKLMSTRSRLRSRHSPGHITHVTHILSYDSPQMGNHDSGRLRGLLEATREPPEPYAVTRISDARDERKGLPGCIYHIF